VFEPIGLGRSLQDKRLSWREAGAAISGLPRTKRPLTRESSAPIRLKSLSGKTDGDIVAMVIGHRKKKRFGASRAASIATQGPRKRSGVARRIRESEFARASPGFEVRRSCLQIVLIAEVDERRVARSART